jgi:hypothetical protein
VRNDSDGVVRYLMIAAHDRFDAIEYIDESRVVVYSVAESALQGEPLFFSHELQPASEALPPHERASSRSAVPSCHDTPKRSAAQPKHELNP